MLCILDNLQTKFELGRFPLLLWKLRDGISRWAYVDNLTATLDQVSLMHMAFHSLTSSTLPTVDILWLSVNQLWYKFPVGLCRFLRAVLVLVMS